MCAVLQGAAVAVAATDALLLLFVQLLICSSMTQAQTHHLLSPGRLARAGGPVSFVDEITRFAWKTDQYQTCA
jgi:hypothetical protein